MSRGETVFASLKELSGDLANIELEYYVTREADGGAGETDGGETEVYGVTENFTLKWSSQRIYMMDYEKDHEPALFRKPGAILRKAHPAGDLRRRGDVRKEK